jgi:(p)ppGpp synthase/HD superfamily hydrolase
MSEEKQAGSGGLMPTGRLASALLVAIDAHSGQKRKGTDIPYISHPIAVAAIALEHGADEDQAMAALLHDAVEDGGAPYALLIRKLFGDRVADIVAGCTDGVPDTNGKKEPWKVRKERYLAHLPKASDDVLLVSGSDKLHNARAIVSDLRRIGVAVFERFSSSMEQTLWYYEELARVHTQRGTAVAVALEQTVNSMKRLAGKDAPHA